MPRNMGLADSWGQLQFVYGVSFGAGYGKLDLPPIPIE